MKATKTWVFIFLLFIPAINVHAWTIPDTGQTKCYNNTAEIPCPAPGEAFYGQDGSYTIDPPSYTKLDANGAVLPDSAATWTMVRDNVTGLIWENKTSDGSIHDGSKTFTWCDKNTVIYGNYQGTCGTGTGDAATDTQAYIKALNDAKFGGFSDWRMPNGKELVTIVDMGRYNPAVNPAWFPSTMSTYPSSNYWSSTNYGGYYGLVWCVDFDYGGVNSSYKLDAYAVRAVRGGKFGSFNNFVNNGDGTVTDTDTGLMWEQGTSSMTWEAALAYAQRLTLAGYDDWRLPTPKELQSIVDYSNLAIDTTFFPGTVSSNYWSATTNAGYVDAVAWYVRFNYGDLSNGYSYKTNAYAVRAVRGGQSRLLGHLVLSEPRRAARWNIGEQKTVTWDPVGMAGNVRISLSRQGGKSETFTETIAEGVPNSGSYAWAVTGPETFSAALRIEPLSDPSKGTTQSLFTMTSLLSAWIAAETLSDTGHYKLTLNGQYTDGVIPLEATFTTSDATVANVNQYGFLTAIKNGYVEVSTIYQSKTYRKGLFVFTTNDAFESGANDTKATANPMQLSTSDPQQARFYKGRLPEGDVDFYSFTQASPSLVNLGYLTYSATADVRVDLYDANDKLLASGTSVNGQPLLLPVGLSAGTYYLKLSKDGDVDDTNYYVVTYRIMDSLPDKSSTPIAFGETKSGSLYHLADHTDFTFSLSEPYRLKFIFTPNGGLARYRFKILNESQTVLNQVECLEQKPVTLETNYLPGSYTLTVTPVGDVDAMNPFSVYFLKISRAEQEPNNTAPQATAWNVSYPIMGILASNTDSDFYRFSIESPRYVDLGFSSPGSMKPFRLRLYKESDQNEIDGVDVENGQSITLPMGLSIGAYYLKVESTDADTINPYTLTLTDSNQTNLEIESNNTFKMANALEQGSPKKGRIYSQDDKDYFGFHMENEGDFTVTFTPSSTVADYKITLVDAADNVYDYFSSTNGQSKSISFYEMPGNYYLRVAPNGDVDPSKTYDLTLTSASSIKGLKQLVSVIVTGAKAEMQLGNPQTLIAKAGYSDASTITVTPVWTSLNPAIATVDGAGFVTAIAEGTTSIVARYGELAGKFDLKVGAPLKVVKQHYGNLILVAGGGIADTNTLKESTQYLSDLVYRRFKSRLFSDADIYYFNPMPWHDLDGDGYGESVVDDSTPTVAKFGQAITNWAASQDTDGPLYVYLIDHGGIDNFMLFPGEIVTADQLKGWLNAFQTTTTGRKVIVMIEACKSGSFTDNLITQGLDRVVVTSADDQDSYIQLGGRISFSQFFVDRLLTGDSLNAAYLKARQQLANMGLPYSKMQPKLVEGVNLSSARTWLGGDFAIASLFAEITETSPNTAIAANPSSPISFYAKLSSLEGIESVWAVVTDPGYMPSSTSGEFEAPTVALPIFALADSEKDLKYEGTYKDFIYNGDYRITFYARNTNGNVSASPATLISVTGGLDTTFKVLTVTKGGPGTGAVTSLPVGIDCGNTCVAAFENGTAIALTASAANDSIFTGWSGACMGTQGCNFAMNISRSVTATFVLKVKGDVDGNGNVSLADAILALQTISALSPASSVDRGVDVNADGKIGLAEAIYILQKVAGMR